MKVMDVPRVLYHVFTLACRCLQSAWQVWRKLTQASKVQALATEVGHIECKLLESREELERERRYSDNLLRVLASDQWARDAVANLCHTGMLVPNLSIHLYHFATADLYI